MPPPYCYRRRRASYSKTAAMSFKRFHTSTWNERISTGVAVRQEACRTPLERARLYFKYRPARVLLAAEPGGGDASGVWGARRHARRGRIASLVAPGDIHDGPAAGVTGQSHRRATRAAEYPPGDGDTEDTEQAGRVRADRGRPADHGDARLSAWAGTSSSIGKGSSGGGRSRLPRDPATSPSSRATRRSFGQPAASRPVQARASWKNAEANPQWLSRPVV
jgi:hypothetical protein